MYRLTDGQAVMRLEDGAQIPFDLGNMDYNTFLEWLEEGNTPIPYVPDVIGVPQEVTMTQARLALLQYDVLDQIEAVIPTLGRAAQIEWEYRPSIHRNHALVTTIKQQFGWTDALLDELFTLAATL